MNGNWKRFYSTVENTITHKGEIPIEFKWFDDMDWFKGIVWVMCNSGMRGAEVRILKWNKSSSDSIHKKVSYSHLDKKLTKISIFFKGGFGEIPLSPKLKRFIKKLDKTKNKDTYVFQNPNRVEGYGKDMIDNYSKLNGMKVDDYFIDFGISGKETTKRDKYL